MDRSKHRDELPWHERYNCEGNHRWPRSGFTYKCVGANGVRYETACNDCLAIHVVFEVTDLAGNITRSETVVEPPQVKSIEKS